MPKSYSKISLDIRTPKHLALRLSIPLAELKEVALQVESLYDSWEISKKSGGSREISSPKPRLKRIQRAVHELLLEIRVHNCAHCGIKARSNLSNANLHCGKRYLFNLDFKNFFPSISNHRVYHLFRHELNCSPEVSYLLTRISTLSSQVPQGAPMSMDIANLVCRRLDTRLEGLAKRYKITYTRHCDDLSFSGIAIPEVFIAKVKEIISQIGFGLNPEKESLCGQHQPQIVTGLSVNRKRPHVPRKTSRQWRKEKHVFDKYESKTLPTVLQLKRFQQIQGKTNYLNYINETKPS